MDVFDDQCVGRGDSQGKTEPLDADEEWINLKEIFGHIGSGQGDPDEETIRQERAEITDHPDHPDHPEDCENCLTDDDDEDLLMALGWLMEKRNAKASARRPKEKTVKELLEELRREIRTEIQTESKAEVQTEKQAEIREDLETELRAELEAEMRARLKAEIEAEMRTRLRAELETEMQAEFQERFEKEISRLDVRAEALLSLIERAEERLNEVEQARDSRDGRDGRNSRDAREVRDRRRFTPAEEEYSEEYLEEEPIFGGKTNTGGFFRTLAISILLAPFIYRGFLWMSDLSYELRAFPLCIAVGAVLLLVTNGASSFRSFLDKLEEDDFEEEVYRKRR